MKAFRSTIFVMNLVLFGMLSSGAKALAQSTIPGSSIPLFTETAKIHVKIEAPFKALWAKSKELNAVPRAPSDKSEEAYVEAKISYEQNNGQMQILPMKLRVRGTTSKVDCDFPKLELKFAKSTNLADTIFENAKEVKIGTHCADVDGISGGYFRLRNQLEPAREVFIYRMAEILQIRSLKTRLAEITYVVTDDGNREIGRNAFFLEDTGSARKRYGGLKEIFVKGSPDAIEAEKEALAEGKKIPGYFGNIEKTDIEETAMVVMFNTIIMNSDFIVKIIEKDQGQKLWNIKAFIDDQGHQLIMPLDFDLAELVLGQGRQGWLTQDIARAKEDFRKYPAVMGPVKNRILAKKEDILTAFAQSDFSYPDVGTGQRRQDEAGQTRMLNFLNSMFEAVDFVL